VTGSTVNFSRPLSVYVTAQESLISYLRQSRINPGADSDAGGQVLAVRVRDQPQTRWREEGVVGEEDVAGSRTSVYEEKGFRFRKRCDNLPDVDVYLFARGGVADTFARSANGECK